ncbi:MAG: hypothetical protein OEV46_09670 [Betaproteobacteria bacterium]|jgi:hypothetical protein|nr:hypothetical protein [Betaproteobacteria bacterium]MDH5286233.1 hypothetical protein [Betaproteobacteria bacterium]
MNTHTTPDPREADDWLEQALRSDAREHRDGYVDDAGFTARVMAALPAAMEIVPRWRRPAVAAIWAAAAAGMAVALPGVALDIGREAYRLLAAQPLSLAQVGVTLAVLGIGTWAAAAWTLQRD